jgi:hypothetical protein
MWSACAHADHVSTRPCDAVRPPAPSFRIPADARPGETIHVIAEATDDGTLSLTRYVRAVVTVK